MVDICLVCLCSAQHPLSSGGTSPLRGIGEVQGSTLSLHQTPRDGYRSQTQSHLSRTLNIKEVKQSFKDSSEDTCVDDVILWAAVRYKQGQIVLWHDLDCDPDCPFILSWFPAHFLSFVLHPPIHPVNYSISF